MRECSLQQYMVIEKADMRAWRVLSEFHYRQERCGAVDQIFALRMKRPLADPSWYCLRVDQERPVGVIVYGMPLPNVALRNRATNNRYVGLSSRAMSLQLLNREIRCINRIVIHPQYRGIGLAQYLVRETLGLAGTPLVEAMASMGHVNPFFARSGMVRYDSDLSKSSERLRAVFDTLGIESDCVGDATPLLETIEGLGVREQLFLERELQRFAVAQNRRVRKRPMSRNELASIVVQSWFAKPVYYLWQRVDHPQAGHARDSNCLATLRVAKPPDQQKERVG